MVNVRRALGLSIFAATLAATLALTGCGPKNYVPTLGAEPNVRYARDKVFPAVVSLDVAEERFVNGQARTIRGTGSGTIIDAEGHILTNFHVAGRAKKIVVTLANKETIKGTLVGADHWTDLALVKLDPEEIKRKNVTFTYAAVGDSEKLELGQPILAIGTPRGLARTMTSGIVSNTDRYMEVSSIDGYETGWFNNWIQIDAAINPGNSGGPLVNMAGEIVGINTRGVTGSNSLGFSVPSNVAKLVIADLLAKGKVTRSYIGVQFQPMQDLEDFYEVTANQTGVLIASVDPESPASRAGVQPEDVLVAVNGQAVNARFPEELAAIRHMIAGQAVDSEIKFTIQRPRKSREIKLDIALKTELLESAIAQQENVASWGATIRNLTRAYLRERRIPIMKGILVTGVRTNVMAEIAGLRSDDIIVRVDGKPVETLEQFRAVVATLDKAKTTFAVDVRRDRNEKTLVFKP